MDLGPTELLIVLAIALLLFGGAKLPKLARSLGEASREFRKGAEGHESETKTADDGESSKPAS
jgi:sec-independent protein translocase protein TatA